MSLTPLVNAFFLCIGAPVYDEGAEHELPDCEESNRALIASLRPDQNEDALHRIAFEDCAKGRMTEPMKVEDASIGQAETLTACTLHEASALQRCFCRVRSCLCRVSA